VKTRIQRWGNSLAVRIPKTFAEEVGITDDTTVEMRLVKGGLVIEPVTPYAPTLEELLEGVTPENIHGEWDTGPAQGRESW
jgi:antitoxin MazE